MIRKNTHKYSVSAMAKVLQINRSTYYYKAKPQSADDTFEKAIVKIFEDNHRVYGARKIKIELSKLGLTVSRRRIVCLMKKNGLTSVYTRAQYKQYKETCNDSKINNELNREFGNRKPLEAVVSDLTYVRVAGRWNYICLLIDLFNREIIGYSCGQNKDAVLVYRAFASFRGNLQDIQLFYTDRGSEFKNQLIDEVIETFNIKRSLSIRGCPYDNAVAGATFKIFKAEFVRNRFFESLDHLRFELFHYIKWFNEKRIHSALGYYSSLEYKSVAPKKIV